MNSIEYIIELKRVWNYLYPLYYWEVIAWELVMAVSLVTGVSSFVYILTHIRRSKEK